MITKLADLEKSSLDRNIPIIGPVKGAWLLEKVKQLQPHNILELGTANGYSGCILGSEGGQLTTIDQDEVRAKEAIENFAKFDIDAEVILGNAVEIVKGLNDKFDLIFIDFSKKNYLKVLEDCIRLCNKGGVIIADNITFDGCQDFKEAVLSDPRLDTEIIDIVDGLSFSRLL